MSEVLSPQNEELPPANQITATPENEGATPFREFILKVHSRCNLACSYCYMYEMADQSWRDQPRLMSDEVVDATAERIAEHAETHDEPQVHVIFHGGEPLLAEKHRPGFYRRTVEMLRQALPAGKRLLLAMQSNGTLLTPGTVNMLESLNIGVGVSIDGQEAANDRHRKYPNGRGSFSDVMRGIRLLQEKPAIYNGVLCTIDLQNDPLETYQALADCKPPSVDFLLPLANWNTLPPNHDPYKPTTHYADWLIPIFDAWYDNPGTAPQVRLFNEASRLLLGQQSMIEYLGLTPPANVVVETDSTIAEVDTLKSARQGMTHTGLNVFEHSFDAALGRGTLRERQMGTAALSEECLKCELVDSCGGGYFPHRYRQEADSESFRNRSVYCADLMKLFTHMSARMRADLEASVQ